MKSGVPRRKLRREPDRHVPLPVALDTTTQRCHLCIPVASYEKDSMKSAAIGFRPHSGWTAVVVLSLEQGEPVILVRERIHLVKVFNYSYRQPYYTAARAGL